MKVDCINQNLLAILLVISILLLSTPVLAADGTSGKVPAVPPKIITDPLKFTPSKIVPATTLLPLNLQTGVTYTTPAFGNIMVPLVVTYVGATAPGENPFVSYIDQPVVAKTTEPIMMPNGNVLPTGTVFTGVVGQIVHPRRLGRNGYAILHFDTIITDKGQIPIATKGRPSHYGRSQFTQTMITVANDALFGANTGLIVGAGVAIALLIMYPNEPLTGMVVGLGGGAVVGLAVGTIYGLSRKGEPAISSMAREVVVPIDVATLERASIPLDLTEEFDAPIVFKSVRTKGLTNPYRLEVEAVVANDSDYVLESSDLCLVNQRGDHFPMYYDNEHNSATNFSVPPHSVRHFWASFEPEMPETGDRLVWYKHLSSLKEPLVQFKLP
jgi:hypothetical protein